MGILLLWAAFSAVSGQTNPRSLSLKTASRHPMQYYLSLPEGWDPGKKWVVVVAVTGGLKDFQHHGNVFVEARKNLPFIIVSPVILTNGGGNNLRNLPEYNYAPAVWDRVDKTGWCEFDFQGLDAVIAEVQHQYNAEEKYFIAGHSAGAHLTWAMALMHPEKLQGAAVTSGNFRSRCVGEISTAPERTRLPIRGFLGEKDEARVPLASQFEDARKLAAAHGFGNISIEVMPGGGHAPYAEEVLEYFNSLRKTAEAPKEKTN